LFAHSAFSRRVAVDGHALCLPAGGIGIADGAQRLLARSKARTAELRRMNEGRSLLDFVKNNPRQRRVPYFEFDEAYELFAGGLKSTKPHCVHFAR
jgi:hypothetical protein